MDQYLELDKGQHLPLSLTLHLLFCKKCRREIKCMTHAEKILHEPIRIPVPLTDNTIESVLLAIDPQFSDSKLKNPISMVNWIISGILMILFMVAFVFSTNSSKDLDVAMSLVLAGCVITYILIFVFSNIEFFIKKINTMKMAV
jgi:hypothetical protein